MAEQGATDLPIEPAPPAYTAPAAGVTRKEQSLELPKKTAPLRGYGLNYRVDPTVSFSEFQYWAKVERAEEREAERLYLERRGPMTLKKAIKSRFSKGIHHENEKMNKQDSARTGPSTEEKGGSEHVSVAGRFKKMFKKSNESPEQRNQESVLATASTEDKNAPDVPPSGSSAASLDEEWKTAARALRTAGWSSIFFLVTTDILGWSGAPYVHISKLKSIDRPS